MYTNTNIKWTLIVPATTTVGLYTLGFLTNISKNRTLKETHRKTMRDVGFGMAFTTVFGTAIGAVIDAAVELLD